MNITRYKIELQSLNEQSSLLTRKNQCRCRWPIKDTNDYDVLDIKMTRLRDLITEEEMNDIEGKFMLIIEKGNYTNHSITMAVFDIMDQLIKE